MDSRQIHDFFKSIPIDYSLLHKRATGAARANGLRSQRPDHVNNQATNYFPPIFNQHSGSCTTSSNIGYMLCYELNSFYGYDGKHDANHQLPTHFAYLSRTGWKQETVLCTDNGIPSVADYGGTTYSRYFGPQDQDEKDWGWMQGYNKWYRAMFNRAKNMARLPYDMATPDGIEFAKDWLWNHAGDEDHKAGGVFAIGIAAGLTSAKIPNTATNQEAGAAGQYYVATWGPESNHIMTVVGYDDRIEFDLDSNGIVGEKNKGEVGAWIIANSWGDGWCNAGTIYCPYANTYEIGLSGNAWDAAIYYPRKNYRPLRTIKLLMDHNRRYELALCAGVSQDTSATAPTLSTAFSHFTYSGASKQGTMDVPMLGRWADGYHTEPMEFGYDLTDLTDNMDRTKPLKYFFYINTKYAASGIGHIYKASIIDYEFEREGIEIPFKIDTIAILNKGKTTMISVIVPGEQTYPPLNLQIANNTLSWQAPQQSSLALKGYAVYCNDKKIAQADATATSYALDQTEAGPYYIKAIYDYQGQDNESAKGNTVYNLSRPTSTKTNTALELRNSSLTIPNAIPNTLTEATIEFWIKPYTLKSWNQQTGYEWGKFLLHTDYSGCVYVGWDTGTDRITSPASTLKVNTWTHIAVTINANVMNLYINGIKKGSITSTNYSGLTAIRNFQIGASTSKFDGQIDELRIWNTCRSQREILANMRKHVVSPSINPNIITYLDMDTTMQEGNLMLNEYCSANDVDLSKIANYSIVEDASFLTGGASTNSVDFTTNADTIYVGESVTATPSISLDATAIEWTAQGATTPTTSMGIPAFTYTKAGSYNINLKTTDANGNTAEKEHTVVVVLPSAPVADFEPTGSVPAGEKTSLINRSIGNNCTYSWSMPGAVTESANTTNVAPIYLTTGRHPVTLTVSNSAGQSSITKYIDVTNAKPSVDFDVTPSAIIIGEKIALTDKSKYEPTKWMWTINNSRHNTGINGQNYAFTPKHPGIYNVTLTATNEIGSNSKTLTHAFTVSNADPQNGLNFAGNGERISFKSPVSTSTKNFTIDYWLYPYSTDGAANLCSDDGIFKTTTDAQGETSMTINGKTVTSGGGYVLPNQWHHYAITYKAGTVVFYRDGEKFSQPSARLALKSPAWTGNVTMGDANTPFSGMIDEFRFWNKTLDIDDIQSTCNAPITNPDSMKANAGLVIDYDFNQTTGNVRSLTGDEYLGTRLGFGPDGDAWASSLGVFTLDFSEKAVDKDVSADYLTNYKAPFFHTTTSVNSTNYVSRFWELQTGEAHSKWIVENTLTEGNVTTGTHVDAYRNNDLACTTVAEGFANAINDQRTYQTTTLPTGRYKLTVTPNTDNFASTGSYLVVNKGNTLVGNKGLNDALAYDYLDNKQVVFDIMEDGTTISLGVIFNMDKNNTVAIEAFTLTQCPYEYIIADNPDAVIDIADNSNSGNYTIAKGGIKCTANGQLTIFDLQGKEIFSSASANGKFVKLPAGIYIVNGTKVSVK